MSRSRAQHDERGSQPQPPCPLDPSGHARRVLEFEKLLEVVSHAARSEGGRRLILGTSPDTDPSRVAERQARVREVRTAFDEGMHSWPLDGIHDLAALVASAERGATFSGLELRQVAETLHAGARMRRFLDEHAQRFEQLMATAVELRQHDDIVQSIHKAVLDNGDIADVASPELARIRDQLVKQRTKILRRLERHLGAADGGASSAGGGSRGGGKGSGTAPGGDAYVTLRAERYVIPVRADAGKIDGIVHDRSGSGATLFVEPLDVVDANNELQGLRDAEVREMQRVLRELTRQIAAQTESIRAAQSALEHIDAVYAAACAAVNMNAATPIAGEAVRLRAARHPLLELRLRERNESIVPLDLDVGDARALVITGPNTGGKTVVLKTLGLLVLMHQSGFQVPAQADSELPMITRLVADIGDEQSIEAAESTFSSHLRHVRDALDATQRGELVLLDEFMAGTDPEEGAALAKVVLRRLVAGGAMVFVTSHLGALKLFAHDEPGLANASMLFDPERRVPLFRMQAGVPGSSNALATAERMGFEARILDEALEERGQEAGRVENVLRALESERRRLQDARENAEAAAAEAKRVREEAAQQLGELTRKRRELVDAARREATDLVSRAQARIEATIRELRETQASRETIRATRAEMAQLRDELDSAVTDDPDYAGVEGLGVAHAGDHSRSGSAGGPGGSRGPGEPGDVPARQPRPGDIVWIRRLQREGRLESVLDDGRASVRYGKAAVMVHLRDLELRRPADAPSPRSGSTGRRPKAAKPSTAPGGFDVDSSELESLEVHVRGLDRDDAIAEVERFLDRALLQGAPMVRIVHGKGAGILRGAVHELLRRHPRVVEFRLGEHGEGAAGVTIATLQ